jgi:methylated-DNA-protein-cysteine methyltransferase-like protein
LVGVDKKRRLVEIEGVKEYAVGCRMVHKDLIYEILSVVEEIPEGCVATYGQIARLIGRDKNSRLVGKVLSMAEYYGDYPCHRVVNHAGRLVPGWLEQRLLLEAEQVVMKDDRHVDLKKCRWDY